MTKDITQLAYQGIEWAGLKEGWPCTGLERNGKRYAKKRDARRAKDSRGANGLEVGD